MVRGSRQGARFGSSWFLVAGLLAVGVAVRALRFGAKLPLIWHWDDVRFAVPARDILDGALPIHVVGVGYIGASYSYVLAPAFWLAGATTRVMDLLAFGHGLLLLGTGYLLARRLFEPPAALFTLAGLAVPPLYLAQWSVNGTVAHPQALVLGNVLLMATHTAFFRQRIPAKRTLLGLGLVAGVGWWTNPAIAVYMLPFGLLALRTGLLWYPRIGLVVLGTVLGSLPQWIYELHYFPSARFALLRAGTEEPSTLPDRLHAIAGTFLPQLVGVDPGLAPGVAALGVVVVLLPWAGAVVRALVRDRRELAWVVGLGGQPAGGGSILWLVVIANVALILITTRQISTWYLLFLYSALPCWMGTFLAWVAARRRWMAGVVLAGLCLFNLGTNWYDTLGSVPAGRRRWGPILHGVTEMVTRLETRGIRHVYWHQPNWPTFELTFFAGGRIVAGDLWRDDAIAIGDIVDAAVRPAILLFHKLDELKALRASLPALGVTVRESEFDELVLFETEPAFAHGFEPLDPTGWTVTANTHPEWASRLVDRDATTGWSTSGPTVPGQWIAVDLGREETVARVDLLSLDWQEIPSGYRVEASRDASVWQDIVSVPDYWGPLFFSEHHAFLKVRRGRLQAIFPPTRARFIRIVQTGKDSRNPWSARELFVYRPGVPRPAAPADGALGAALAREGVQFVYANHWVSARVLSESRGRIGALESNINRDPYGGYTEPPPERVGASRLSPGVGIVVGSDGDREAVRETLRGQRLTWRETMAGPYPLLVVTGRAPRPRCIQRDGWRATADQNPEAAARAIDGKFGTRWSAATPGGQLTLDLGRRQRVSRVELLSGAPSGTAQDFHLSGSVDGQTWSVLGPARWAGRVYWDGTEFLRRGGRGWRVEFPPAEIRYLRLAAAWPEPDAWGVAEVRCLD